MKNGILMLIYIIKGTIHCSSADVSENDLLLLPEQSQIQLDPSEDCSFLWIEFNRPYLQSISEPEVPKGCMEIVRRSSIVPLKMTIPEKLKALICFLMEEVKKEYDQKLEGYNLCIRHRLIELFLLIHRNRLAFSEIPIEPRMKGIRSQRFLDIDEVIKYVQEHYAEELFLNDIASSCNLNTTYFCRFFKEHTGMPVFEFINNIRIRKACHLLKTTDMPIIDIAYSVGYNNLSFFNRYFKKLMNQSPRDYRIQSRK